MEGEDTGTAAEGTMEEDQGSRDGWRAIQIARTASVEVAKSIAKEEIKTVESFEEEEEEQDEDLDEEEDVFPAIHLEHEVDVDLEIMKGEEEEEEMEEDSAFDFFGPDGYFSGNLPPLPPSPRPSRLSEVTLETIGETSTDTMEEEEDANPTTWKTTLETVGEIMEAVNLSLEDIGETCTDDDILDDDEYSVEEVEEDQPAEGEMEEAIFEKELTMFAEELDIPISKEQSTEDLEYVASYFTFLTFARVIQSTYCHSAVLHLQLTLNILSEMLNCKKDSIGIKDVLKEPKKKAAEILLEAFTAMKARNIKEVCNLLEEGKKKLEKELKVVDIMFRDRVTATRQLIFVECLLKCYNCEKNIFMPIYLMQEPAKDKMVKKMKKHLTKLIESLGRKRNDSKWKKFGGGTIDKTKETREGGQGMVDDLLSITYPLMSEAGLLTRPVQLVETNKSFVIRLWVGWLPRGEENHAVLTIGRIVDWVQGGEEEEEELFSPIYIFAWRSQSSVCLRLRHLLFQTWLEPGVEEVQLELCLEDNRELESVRVVGGQELECRMEVPACARQHLMEEARAGKVEVHAYLQARRLGLFYLEQAFSLYLYEVDEEGRSLAHYLAWIGEEVALGHLLALIPVLANMADDEGDTPLHLAIRGGASCSSATRILLSLPYIMMDLTNQEGQTPLHMAARYNSLTLRIPALVTTPPLSSW